MAINITLVDTKDGRELLLGRFNEGSRTRFQMLSTAFDRGHLERLGCVTDWEVRIESDPPSSVALLDLKHMLIV